MANNTSALKRTRTVIKRSTNNVVKRVLNLHENIEGREEQITDQLASEITLHLIEEIRSQLDGKNIEGINFSITVYQKKAEEPITGADFVGILDIDLGDRKIKKVYLAQAKIGKVIENDTGQEIVKFSSPDIIRQVNNMLALTNSAYVFVYTKSGINIISAEYVKALNSKTIRIEKSQTHDTGYLYEQLFDCWAGDPKLIPYPVNKTNLEYFAGYTNAHKVILIEGNPENQDKNKSTFSFIEI